MAYWTGSTTALAGNATWTGPTRLRERHDTVQGTVKSDVAGTLNVQLSPDGTNWDVVTAISVVGGTGQGFTARLDAPFWRLVYVNGGSNQANFRVQATTQAGGDS